MSRNDAIAVSILLIIVGLVVAGFIYVNFLAPGDSEEEEEEEAENETGSVASIECDFTIPDGSTDEIVMFDYNTPTSLMIIP